MGSLMIPPTGLTETYGRSTGCCRIAVISAQDPGAPKLLVKFKANSGPNVGSCTTLNWIYHPLDVLSKKSIRKGLRTNVPGGLDQPLTPLRRPPGEARNLK